MSTSIGSTSPPQLPPAAMGPASERLVAIDGVRGLALLGIALMNIEAFNGPIWLSSAGVDPRWEGIDRWLDAAIYVVVQGSFFPLFSLLFGIGFGLMGQRAQARGVRFAPLHLRRMAWLALIGLLHAVLLWSGDVLLTYALLGALLPPLMVLAPRWQAALGACGILATTTLILLVAGAYAVLGNMPDNPALAAMEQVRQQVEAQARIYGAGSYAEAVGQRLQDLGSSLQSVFVMGGQILGLFLVGCALVRSGALADRAGHVRLWAGLRWLAWPAGLLLSLSVLAISPYNPPWSAEPAAMLAQAVKVIAGSLIGLGWLAWGLRAQRLLALLAPAGQMSLSTYLGQSLAGTLCFYGYGLGWFGSFSRSQEVVFVLLMFTAQVLLARLWLRHFRQGPVEWLWRSATYGGGVPLRR